MSNRVPLSAVFVLLPAIFLIRPNSTGQTPANVQLLREAYEQLRPLFGFTLTTAGIRPGNRSLAAFAEVAYPSSPNGCIELHVQLGGHPSVWVAVPDWAWRREHRP